MEHLEVPKLLDEHGQPLSTHIDGVLRRLVPKFRRQFPAVRDELDLTEILEKAGERIAVRERRGPIERLHAYAWVALQSAAKSWMRRGASRLMRRTVAPESSESVLATVQARSGSPEEIEQTILLHEAMAHLTEVEWIVCNLKMMGLSSEEIARRRGTTKAAIDMVFSRAKQKLRRLLNISERAPRSRVSSSASRGQVTGSSPLETDAPETADGQTAPESRAKSVHGRE
jgi:RNA polymerase sigma factor (sigma-70 family)